MKVLVLGGTRFIGYFLVQRLLAAGHAVTVLTRGLTPDPFGDRIERIKANRTTGELARALIGRSFEATIDLIAYSGDDARGFFESVGDRAGHYVMISTGQVYLVRADRNGLASELAYDGALMPAPASPAERSEWDYGIGKRDAEDELARAWVEQRFPSTRIRLPMVNGLRDPYRRIERYLVRLLDSGPVILPDGGAHEIRHVYVRDVARAVTDLLGHTRTFGQAYNLAQRETPTLLDLVRALAELVGAKDRTAAVERAAIEGAGLDPVLLSPFSGRWMSFLDPGKAEADLGFKATPIATALEAIVAGYLAHPPDTAPDGYDRRADEIALARQGLG